MRDVSNTNDMMATNTCIPVSPDILDKAPRFDLSRRDMLKGLAAGTLIPMVASCTTNPITGENQFIIPGLGSQALAAMSRSAWRDMKKEIPQVQDESIVQSVVDVWQRTLKARKTVLQDKYLHEIQDTPDQWEIAVFDSDAVNAFVMPGRQVGVFRGLIDLIENEDQLASVLGHEAAHIDGRHAEARASAQILAQVAITAGEVAIAQSDSLRKYGDELGALGGAAIQFGVLLPYSRAHELQADKLGVDYLYGTGYDVTQVLELWKVMEKSSAGKSPPEFLSTHPDPGRRHAVLTNYINANGYAFV